MRIYELFPFHNELDLLRLHLMETEDIVDVWGIAELPVTFTGKPKPLHFHENRDQFARWLPRIREVPITAYPDGGHPMVDWFQRRSLGHALHDAKPEDLVILTDVDEIPSVGAIERVRSAGYQHPVTLLLDLYYYGLTWKDETKWPGTVVAPRWVLGSDPDLQKLRDHRGVFPKIEDGGWHFSWFGGVDRVLEKLRAVDIEKENEIYGSDGIKAPPADREWLNRVIEDGRDLFGRSHRPKKDVPILPGVTHPRSTTEWLGALKS